MNIFLNFSIYIFYLFSLCIYPSHYNLSYNANFLLSVPFMLVKSNFLRPQCTLTAQNGTESNSSSCRLTGRRTSRPSPWQPAARPWPRQRLRHNRSHNRLSLHRIFSGYSRLASSGHRLARKYDMPSFRKDAISF